MTSADKAIKIILLVAGLLILGAVVNLFNIYVLNPEHEIVSTSVEKADVEVSSTVSGRVSANLSAELSFPTIGTIKNIYKNEGDTVTEGEVIASLTQDVMLAQYNAALKNVDYYKSLKASLLNGPRSEIKKVSETSVRVAAENLAKAENEQNQLVSSAYRLLLSTDLEALPVNKDNFDEPPVVSGSYQCNKEGLYNITTYSSKSPTDYSFTVSGLEEGTYTAWTGTPVAFGLCGLHLQFSDGTRYGNEVWQIEIPNKRSSSYLTNLNNYQLALEQKERVLSQLRSALDLAKDTESRDIAGATKEEIGQVEAQLQEALAVLSGIEAQINNYIIKAPFSGLVTDVDMKVGETADATKKVSIINDSQNYLKIRIPEVDIREVKVGNSVLVKFDADPDNQISGTIDYISPKADLVEGVAYYEAKIELKSNPTWLREGLSADVKIILNQKKQTLTIPVHFLIKKDNQFYLKLKNADSWFEVPVELGLVGTNGLAEVINLPEGTLVAIP